MGRVISDLGSFSETVANGDLLVCHNVSKAVNTRDEKLTVEKLLTDALGNRSVTITSGGDVGIGTTTPTQKLQVIGALSSNYQAGTVVRSIDLAMDSLTAGCVSTLRDDNDTGNLIPILFRQSANNGSTFLTRMIINAAGDVGIGTTTPTQKLQVIGALSSNYAAGTTVRSIDLAMDSFSAGCISTLRDDNDSGSLIPILFRQSANNGSTFLTRMVIDADGDVGIGTTTPSEKLHVVGGARISNLTSGTVYSDANGVLNNSASDARMKRDVQAIEANDALAIVDALRPVRYRWNEEYAPSLGEQVEVGLIAQEVLAHVPEVIGTNRDGMLSLEYARLTALLVGAVQALTARVEALEAAAAA